MRMWNIFYRCNFLLLFILFAVVAESATVNGVVFSDGNGNGIFDKGEKGIGKIRVSNGDTIVFTDRNGCFSLPVEQGESVFPILPSEYGLSGDRRANAGFFYYGESDSVPAGLSFGLVRGKAKDSFRIAAIGDIQVDANSEENYTGMTLMPDLLSRKDIDLGIALGDLVNNDYGMYPDVYAMLSEISWPVWTLPGNHDRDMKESGPMQERRFSSLFGAATYSFDYGDVHFIILNNVLPLKKRDYMGGYTDRQLRFLANDLKYVPDSKLLVICQHIPLSHTRDAGRLLELLKGRGEVLMLSGHTHTVMRNIINGNGVTVHDLTAGATCGSWWQGERAWNAVPSGLMNCGAPRCYFTADFKGNSYKIAYKGVNLDASVQMDIWVNSVDTLDNRIKELAALPVNFITANVYGACDSSCVEVNVDGKGWEKMEKATMADPNITRLIELTRDKVYPARYSDRYVLRRSASPHIWSFTPERPFSAGVHRISVRAADKYGFSATGDRVIFVK